MTAGEVGPVGRPDRRRRARQCAGAAVIERAGVDRQAAGIGPAIPAVKRQRAGTAFHQRQEPRAGAVGSQIAVANRTAVRAVRGIVDRQRGQIGNARLLLGVLDDPVVKAVADSAQRLIVPQQFEVMRAERLPVKLITAVGAIWLLACRAT